ncbi:3-oxoacyl-ACP synthase [candidate division KD3-62 bacterium DG_56]|uniref:Beta-ketoacyl-[acyl-carrier-protein] synthase III n=1 Tax=candidate division KD3-62 bacterium DG_56 TaxID=1704032 RepID=A0A0S7XMV1_9BACT|nr:MAG: 3-oxoacyl-ACP synthase [candidate division KD3-62 bacterium DG_56]
MAPSLRSVGILGIGSHVPERVLTNAELERMVDTSDEWIITRTGICERRIAEDGTAASDLALPAARQALEMAQVAPEDLDLVVVATVSPDMPFPATAGLVQDKLGASKAAAFDLGAGCTGFIYALAVGAQPIATGLYENALVIGAEALSKITDWTDRRTCVLLGDGAGAAVLAPAENGRELLSFYLRSDGSGWSSLHIPAGGTRLPATEATVRDHLHYIHMNGQEIFKFAVRVLEEAILVALDRAGVSLDQVKLIVPHQANIRIIDAAAKRLNLPMDRFVCNVDRYGNTSAASIPIALDEAHREGRIQPGDYVVLVAFGAGLTWGATVLRW